MSTEWWLIYVDDCDWGTRDSNGVAKVSALLWRYADLRKVIIFDVSARDELDRHGRLRSCAAQGRQPCGVEVKINLTGVKAAAKRCK
jgi:hypothetical protein